MGTGPTDPAELRALAEHLAATAGGRALVGRRSLGTGGRAPHDTKSSVTDPVTEFDRAAERLIVAELELARPDDAIVGEEGSARPGTTGLEWHIDPIDGTVNFVHDLPTWATSVAVVDAAGPLAAAVFAPALDEMFSAARGHGATLNGEAIHVTSVDDLGLALVGTGFAYDADRRREQGAVAAQLLPEISDIRRFGSAALDLCLLAAGRIDAYYERHLNSWDRLGGELIAAEAGADVRGWFGGPPSADMVVAANPALVPLMVDALERIAPRQRVSI